MQQHALVYEEPQQLCAAAGLLAAAVGLLALKRQQLVEWQHHC